MDKNSQGPVADPDASRLSSGGERLVYVMSPDAMSDARGHETGLTEFWSIIWRDKWVVIGVAALFALSSWVYVLNATVWYRATVLLAPAETKGSQGLAGQLGAISGLSGLAGLAGINIGAGNVAEPLAVLTSREFTGDFIEKQNLLPVLLVNKWDAKTGRWKSRQAQDQPDIRDAIKYFDEKVRRVSEDKKTGLVTLAIEWTDSKIAADWANLLIGRLNERMRQRALVDAEANVKYLRQELVATNVVTLQQSIGRLLDTELQKLMIARGKEEFAFRVLDPAQAPKWRSKPKRVQTVSLAFLGGAVLASLGAFMLHYMRRRDT